MANDAIVPYSVDDVFASSGIGSLDKAIGLNISGINHRQTPSPVPRNKESQGFVFFTRPQLNMQGDNLRNFRLFYDLLTDNPKSLERAIRCLLDPRLMAGYRYGKADKNVVLPLNSPLVNNECAFIPFMTNNLNTLTGWPEQVMTLQDSKPDVYNGVRSQPNGVIRNNGKYTLTGNFRNTFSDPLIKLIHYWTNYMSAVSTTGELRPYADFEAMDILDCNTRIYRIVLDPQRSRVTKIFACGAAIPTSNAISAAADFNRETPYSEQNKDLTVTFECNGFIPMDPILIWSFNSTVEAFCHSMKDQNRESLMTKVNKLTAGYFNFIAHPRINPDNLDFEWWVPNDKYNEVAAKIVNMLSVPDNPNENAPTENDGD